MIPTFMLSVKMRHLLPLVARIPIRETRDDSGVVLSGSAQFQAGKKQDEFLQTTGVKRVPRNSRNYHRRRDRNEKNRRFMALAVPAVYVLFWQVFHMSKRFGTGHRHLTRFTLVLIARATIFLEYQGRDKTAGDKKVTDEESFL